MLPWACWHFQLLEGGSAASKACLQAPLPPSPLHYLRSSLRSPICFALFPTKEPGPRLQPSTQPESVLVQNPLCEQQTPKEGSDLNLNSKLFTVQLPMQLVILCLLVEYATTEVSRPSFTVETLLLSMTTVLVSIGNIQFH